MPTKTAEMIVDEFHAFCDSKGEPRRRMAIREDGQGIGRWVDEFNDFATVLFLDNGNWAPFPSIYLEIPKEFRSRWIER